jgi:hypothetical protein
MMPYSEFVKLMSEDQKKRSQELFDLAYGPYKDQEPIMIVSRNPNDKNYVKKVAVKVSMDDWEND